MCKKFFSLTLACLLFYTGAGFHSAYAKSNPEKQARLAEKIKVGIFKLGIGKESRVAVRLRDKTKLAGYISEIKEDSFVLTDLKTGTSTAIDYSDVTQVKGNSLSKGAKIAIWAGIAFAIFLLLFYRYAD
ncbi:MAG: hypothetical protein L0229_17430 [Blastocatellia bacterium]|nr:hypothetical protein [Blastocatellia bacterium]